MLGRPSARSTLNRLSADERPAQHCPRALVRGEAYSSRSAWAYLLSDGTRTGHLSGRRSGIGRIAWIASHLPSRTHQCAREAPVELDYRSVQEHRRLVQEHFCWDAVRHVSQDGR